MTEPSLQSTAGHGQGSVVLVFRALQVGDMLCAIPAFRALRQQHPASTIILIGLPWAHQLLPRFASLIDRILPFPGHPALPEQAADLAAFDNFLTHVRTLGADLSIQLHGSGEVSNCIVESFGAKRMRAFSRSEADCRSPSYVRWPEHGHEVQRCLSLVRALATDTGEALHDDLADEALDFPLTEDDGIELARTGLPASLKGRDYVCIHAGARSIERRWPTACFAQVADALAATGLSVVLTGSGAEWQLAEQVRQQMRYPASNAALPYSLGALAVLLRDARLLVCNDTGVSHLAAAIRTSSVVVFTGSDPERWAPLDHRRHVSIRDSEGVYAADVLRAAMRLLAEPATKNIAKH